MLTGLPCEVGHVRNRMCSGNQEHGPPLIIHPDATPVRNIITLSSIESSISLKCIHTDMDKIFAEAAKRSQDRSRTDTEKQPGAPGSFTDADGQPLAPGIVIGPDGKPYVYGTASQSLD